MAEPRPEKTPPPRPSQPAETPSPKPQELPDNLPGGDREPVADPQVGLPSEGSIAATLPAD